MYIPRSPVQYPSGHEAPLPAWTQSEIGEWVLLIEEDWHAMVKELRSSLYREREFFGGEKVRQSPWIDGSCPKQLKGDSPVPCRVVATGRSEWSILNGSMPTLVVYVTFEQTDI